ncbi:MAG: sugar ABC transporter ATP-binding protein [Solirubrobacterales bacterium]
MSTETIEFQGIRRTFGVTVALDSIDLTIRRGTVHALVGENGAGKSTALGILAGRLKPTEGTVTVFGKELPYGDPRACLKDGIAAIYQELTTVPALSPEANVFLGQTESRLGFLARRGMRRRYEELCAQLGVEAKPSGVPAGRLAVADQQLLEVLRALQVDANIVLFDEPTASLAEHEREAVLTLMKNLRARGITVVFVSHHLEEVLEVCDDISVFRDGSLIASRPRAEWNHRSLVDAMLGVDKSGKALQEIESNQAPAAAAPVAAGTPVLRAAGLTLPGAVEDVELEIREGEIVGLGGMVGSGRTSVLRCLAGLEPRSRGRLWIDGEEVAWPKTVRRALSYGITLVPEDRKGQGLGLALSAADNVMMSNFGAVSRFGFLRPSRLRAAAAAEATPFGFATGRIGSTAGHLSGGNQQKLLLARAANGRPRVLLVDEPTRGIDVGAKAEILLKLKEMVAAGMSIVFVSSELEEVAGVSDRVLVLNRGQVVGVVEREDRISPASILSHVLQVEEAV